MHKNITVKQVRENAAHAAASILTARTNGKPAMATIYAETPAQVEFVPFADEWLATCPICGEAYWGENKTLAATAACQHQQHVAECLTRDFDGAMFALRSRVSMNRRQDLDDCLPEWKQYGLQAGIDF